MQHSRKTKWTVVEAVIIGIIFITVLPALGLAASSCVYKAYVASFQGRQAPSGTLPPISDPDCNPVPPPSIPPIVRPHDFSAWEFNHRIGLLTQKLEEIGQIPTVGIAECKREVRSPEYANYCIIAAHDNYLSLLEKFVSSAEDAMNAFSSLLEEARSSRQEAANEVERLRKDSETDAQQLKLGFQKDLEILSNELKILSKGLEELGNKLKGIDGEGGAPLVDVLGYSLWVSRYNRVIRRYHEVIGNYKWFQRPMRWERQLLADCSARVRSLQCALKAIELRKREVAAMIAAIRNGVSWQDVEAPAGGLGMRPWSWRDRYDFRADDGDLLFSELPYLDETASVRQLSDEIAKTQTVFAKVLNTVTEELNAVARSANPAN